MSEVIETTGDTDDGYGGSEDRDAEARNYGSDDTSARAREIAAGLTPLISAKAIMIIAARLMGTHRPRGRLTDKQVAIAARALVQLLGEPRSVDMGLADWCDVEGVDIPGLGSATHREAQPNDIGRAVARILAGGA